VHPIRDGGPVIGPAPDQETGGGGRHDVAACGVVVRGAKAAADFLGQHGGKGHEARPDVTGRGGVGRRRPQPPRHNGEEGQAHHSPSQASPSRLAWSHRSAYPGAHGPGQRRRHSCLPGTGVVGDGAETDHAAGSVAAPASRLPAPALLHAAAEDDSEGGAGRPHGERGRRQPWQAAPGAPTSAGVRKARRQTRAAAGRPGTAHAVQLTRRAGGTTPERTVNRLVVPVRTTVKRRSGGASTRPRPGRPWSGRHTGAAGRATAAAAPEGVLDGGGTAGSAATGTGRRAGAAGGRSAPARSRRVGATTRRDGACGRAARTAAARTAAARPASAPGRPATSATGRGAAAATDGADA
jgi:hypothetical protein